MIDQAKQISKLEVTVTQYKDLLTQSSKLAGMVCFKLADLANISLKHGHYFKIDQTAKESLEHGVHNEAEWHDGFLQNYEKLIVKEKKTSFVHEKCSQNFKPLVKLLELVYKKKDEYLKVAKERPQTPIIMPTPPTVETKLDETQNFGS